MVNYNEELEISGIFLLENYSEEEKQKILGWKCRYILICKKDESIFGYVEWKESRPTRLIRKLNKRVIWKQREKSSKELIEDFKKSELIFERGRLPNQYDNAVCIYGGTNKRLCKVESCMVCFNRSFAISDKAKYWDYEKNKGLTPRDAFYCSRKSFFFICPTCVHSFETVLHHMTSKDSFCPFCGNRKLCGDINCISCFNRSFASHEKSKWWDYELNDKNPINVSKFNSEKFNFICNECDHKFDAVLSNVSRGDWCPYCGHARLCTDLNCKRCFDRSFASHEKAKFWFVPLNKLTPREIFMCSDTEHYFCCPNCKHIFKMRIATITHQNSFCPYCAKGSAALCDNLLCDFCKNKSFESHPKSKYWIHEKNGISPRFVCKSTDKKFYFKCKYGHEFQISPAHINNLGNWCRFCLYKGEAKMSKFLKSIYPDVEVEKIFNWCLSSSGMPMRFDFYIKSLSIAIELDGKQHFEQVSNWEPPDTHRRRDIFKVKCAIKNGITVIRLLQREVIKAKDDWKTYLKEQLYPREFPVLICKCNDSTYDNHIRDFQNSIDEDNIFSGIPDNAFENSEENDNIINILLAIPNIKNVSDEIVENTIKIQNTPGISKYTKETLEKLNMTQLKVFGKDKCINHYYKMKKSDLIDAILNSE